MVLLAYQTTEAPTQHNIGWYYDFENILQGYHQSDIYISAVKDSFHTSVLAAIHTRLVKYAFNEDGERIVKVQDQIRRQHRGYMDWKYERIRELRARVVRCRVELVSYDHKAVKNAADVKLCVDILSEVISRKIMVDEWIRKYEAHPDQENIPEKPWMYTHVVIVSGDGGFYHLVKQLQLLGVFVVGAGYALHSNIKYAEACDDFVFLPEPDFSSAIIRLRAKMKSSMLKQIMLKALDSLLNANETTTLVQVKYERQKIDPYYMEEHTHQVLNFLVKQCQEKTDLHARLRSRLGESFGPKCKEDEPIGVVVHQIRRMMDWMPSQMFLKYAMKRGMDLELVWTGIKWIVGDCKEGKTKILNNLRISRADVLRFLCYTTPVCVYTTKEFRHTEPQRIPTNRVFLGLRSEPPAAEIPQDIYKMPNCPLTNLELITSISDDEIKMDVKTYYRERYGDSYLPWTERKPVPEHKPKYGQIKKSNYQEWGRMPNVAGDSHLNQASASSSSKSIESYRNAGDVVYQSDEDTASESTGEDWNALEATIGNREVMQATKEDKENDVDLDEHGNPLVDPGNDFFSVDPNAEPIKYDSALDQGSTSSSEGEEEILIMDSGIIYDSQQDGASDSMEEDWDVLEVSAQMIMANEHTDEAYGVDRDEYGNPLVDPGTIFFPLADADATNGHSEQFQEGDADNDPFCGTFSEDFNEHSRKLQGPYRGYRGDTIFNISEPSKSAGQIWDTSNACEEFYAELGTDDESVSLPSSGTSGELSDFSVEGMDPDLLADLAHAD